MSDTIDVGIDLGTTNSAVAVVDDDGTAIVIKNNDGDDITPSAVWMPNPGEIEVGRRARDRAAYDTGNCAAEFKQEMGLADAGHAFAAAGMKLGPAELSAEVLKSLRGDVAHVYGTAPDAAVITIPAAFTLNQNNATKDAATLAGLGAACPLVQEPTAAAVAYGFEADADRAYWMVFDFGGGTFDAAIVSRRDGDLRVINHAGDPFLGGKLIDRAIVERLLAPAAAKELGLDAPGDGTERSKRAYGLLKNAAQDAKIQLSRRESVPISVELPIGDHQETFAYTLRRGAVDALAEPLYVRAINLCRDALKEGGLGPGDIDRLLLVGGVTLAPGLRERLADPQTGLGIELDHSMDPTTAVARGAAVLAGTMRRPVATPAPKAGEFTVELEYEPSVTTTSPTVAGKLHSAEPVDWTTYSVVLDNPRGKPPYRSPRVAVGENGGFAVEVDVREHTTSRFTVELLDGTGARQKLAPDTLTITHRELEQPGVVLTHTLGIQIVDRGYAPIVRKGATLPKTERRVFRTSGELRRSDTDTVLRIPVMQGENERGDRNKQVGILLVRSRDLRVDLPADTEVEVTFEVDDSSLVTVIADVPVIGTQFEAEIDLDDVRAPSPEELEDRLGETETRLADLREKVLTSGSPAAEAKTRALDDEDAMETVRELVHAARTDKGAAAAAEDRLRNIQADLDDIEEAMAVPELARDLRAVLDDAETAVGRDGGAPDDRIELADLRRRSDTAIAAEDPAAIREMIDRVSEFAIGVERRSPDWPVKLFYMLRAERGAMRPADQADALVREGERAIAANDANALSGVNERLIRLLPRTPGNPPMLPGQHGIYLR